MQLQSHKSCKVPHQKKQIDFAGPTNNKKKRLTIYILTCIDQFSKYPSIEIFDIATASNAKKFLDNYIQFHAAALF